MRVGGGGAGRPTTSRTCRTSWTSITPAPAVLLPEQRLPRPGPGLFRAAWPPTAAVHAEIFFDPADPHRPRRAPSRTVADGLLAGMAEAEGAAGASPSKLILCFLRHLDEEAAFATLESGRALSRPDRGRRARCSEVGHPPSKFARVFAAGRGQGPEAASPTPARKGRRRMCGRRSTCCTSTASTTATAALEDAALVQRLAAEQHDPDRLPAVQPQALRGRRHDQHHLEADADARPSRHGQFRRPGLFRRLSERQLPGGRPGAARSTKAELVTLAKNSFEVVPPAEIDRRLAEIDAYMEGA